MARRVYPHGESSGARAGLPIRSHAHAYARCPLPVVLTCHPSQVAIWSQASLEALAQLTKLQTCACFGAGLPRPRARIAIG